MEFSVFTLFIIALTAPCINPVECLEQDSSVFIKLQHALNQGPIPTFTERGNITIHSLRLKQALVNQSPLTEQEKLQLQQLSKKNELYKVRAVVTAQDGSQRTFISSVKACMLAESELDDKFSISLDYIGRVIGVTSIIASKSTCEGSEVSLERLNEFTTTVYVRHTETGVIPDTASFMQKIEREREAQAKGEVKDNRSFLAKYWMYILPVVIIMIISTANNPDAQGGGAGGGQ
ncbi:ER membrane protein complex subunit 10 [Euwallacea fornicatus]|uniref:ER membrane protein complex subunit 10 n=1 Tax=Euwallacea fornicatus TaxID=995702 RepID=UPI0033904F8B